MAGSQCEACGQPFLGAEIHLSPPRQALERSTGYITVLFQIAHGEVIVALIRGGITAETVFLACSVADCIAVPVEVVGIARQDACI